MLSNCLVIITSHSAGAGVGAFVCGVLGVTLLVPVLLGLGVVVFLSLFVAGVKGACVCCCVCLPTRVFPYPDKIRSLSEYLM